MISTIIADALLYFIAHDGATVFHTGSVRNGQELTTGLPNLETFSDRAVYVARCEALGVEPTPEVAG